MSHSIELTDLKEEWGPCICSQFLRSVGGVRTPCLGSCMKSVQVLEVCVLTPLMKVAESQLVSELNVHGRSKKKDCEDCDIRWQGRGTFSFLLLHVLERLLFDSFQNNCAFIYQTPYDFS